MNSTIQRNFFGTFSFGLQWNRIVFVSCIFFILINNTMEQAQNLSQGISSFARDLYQACADESAGKNIILSPLSVSTALALLSQGAEKNTFDQIARGLHLSNDKSAIANGFSQHYESLVKGIGKSTLNIANQLYVKNGYQIKSEYHDVAVKQFRSGIESINFAESMAAAKTINTFVEEKTNNKIKNLIDASALNERTRLVLINAIYFKGDWEKKFDKDNTEPGNFYIDETNTVSVDFMKKSGDFNFVELDDLNASALELKYAESNISFVVILPNSRTGLTALEGSLKNYDIAQITSKMRERPVDVSLPKFKIEFKIQLNDVLKKLGMEDMFTGASDFSGLLASPEGLQVSEVIHKAFIEVNEEGAEAAAATGMIMMCRSMPFYQPFHADHAFLYFILDTKTNTILFSGRCTQFD